MRRRHTAVSILASAALLTALLGSADVAAPAAATETTDLGPQAVISTAPAPATGWTTVFADDFSGAAGAPVSSKWIHELGRWGTGAVDTTTASTANVFLDGDGHLSIRALQDATGAWTSGRIITAQKDFAAPEGGQLLMTASIKQPNPELATGYWPAFWALGLAEDGSIDWPRTGEIDILESVNGTSQLFQTFHCGPVDGGACNEPYGLTSGMQTCDGCLTEYHTYSALVDRTTPGAGRIEFMLDGVVRHTVEEAVVGQEAWQDAIGNDYFLILNLAIGGGLPNGVCGCDSAAAPKTSGGTMSVDHVAVYRKAPPQPQIVAGTPSISGTAAVGQTLTAYAGTWVPGDVTLSYAWHRNGVAIPGATGSRYTLTADDAATTVSVQVTGTKAGYTSATATSAGRTVEARLTSTPVPKIQGKAAVGKTLTVQTGTWAPSPVVLTYQWRRNGVAIAGATGPAYTVTSTDRRTTITVSVTGSKAGYPSVTKTSAGVTVR